MKNDIYIGTAGWNLPVEFQDFFSKKGSHLERYAQSLNSVEINSSFYKDHQYKTYKRWSDSVPEDFRFSVKLSRHFTQETSLLETENLAAVLEGISGLGNKWKVLLVQLPPSLEFEAESAEAFIDVLKENLKGIDIVWEPRHISWTQQKALQLLSRYQISKVMADPEPCQLSDKEQSQVDFIRYLRLHGSPQIYKSRYDERVLRRISEQVKTQVKKKSVWCIFDNTTYGYASKNALDLKNTIKNAKENVPFDQWNIGT